MADQETPLVPGTRVVLRVPEGDKRKVYWDVEGEYQLEFAANWYNCAVFDGKTGAVAEFTDAGYYRIVFDSYVKNFIYDKGNYAGVYQQLVHPDWVEEE